MLQWVVGLFILAHTLCAPILEHFMEGQTQVPWLDPEVSFQPRTMNTAILTLSLEMRAKRKMSEWKGDLGFNLGF